MNEYRILISHVSKDKDIALKLVEKFQGCEMTVGDETIRLKLIYMESKEDGCFGDFREWSGNAVRNCDCVLAIITNNTLENNVLDDGVFVNYKIEYDEISQAKDNHKDIILLKDRGCGTLSDGYENLLQNISSVFFDGETDEKVVDELKQSILLHVRRRLAGDPLLEYAGKINVKLQPAVIGNTDYFLGRGTEIGDIEKLYNSGKNIVCLCGFGGIGKTTLAKMYAHAHPEENVSICYCNAEESSLKNAIVSLKVKFDSPDYDKMNIDQKYALRVEQLKQLGSRALIIIDNFNADFVLNENRKVLSDMASIDTCQFLISSRNGTLNRGDVATYRVGSLSQKELMDLFYRDSKCERNPANDESIKKLIDITDGHTMTIELCAKAVGVDENGISVQDIVDFLSSEAVTRLEDSAREDGHDEYDTIYNHLRQLFALTKITDEQKKILGALSWVCHYGLTIQELKDTIGCDNKAMIDLGRLGYVQKTESDPIGYFLHPLMSELSFKDFVTDAEEYRKVIALVVNDKSMKTSEDTADTLEVRLAYGIHIA
ncbi:MAG: AAA family ATPase, partial [Christensenellales bacterium]